jgi:CSLREA domain-containing protein
LTLARFAPILIEVPLPPHHHAPSFAERRPWLPLAAALALALAAGSPAVRAAPRAIIAVTTAADEHDTAGSGTGCALREAIIAANGDAAFGGCPAGSGDDVILLPAGGYTLTLPGPNEDLGATGDLDIRSALVLSGTTPAETVVHGGGLDRVFDISGTVSVELAGLTITGGSLPGGLGAGLLNRSAKLTLTHAAVISNSSLVVVGGLVNQDGHVLIAHSEIRGNSPGSLYSAGGSLSLVDSLVRDNAGGPTLIGSGVIQSSQILDHPAPAYGLTVAGQATETVLVQHSVISANHAGISHGGAGTLTLIGTSLSHNATTGLRSSTAGAHTVLVNSTVSGNQRVGVEAAAGRVDLYNVTIAGNSSGALEGGGLSAALGATVMIHNSMIAGNSDPGGQAPDCLGSLVSGGYNLVGSTVGCTLTGTLTGNQLGLDPMVGPLSQNGGPTSTHALLPGSPAINAGDPAGCADGTGTLLATDQRGFNRVDRCDIGAFEFGADPFRRLFLPWTLAAPPSLGGFE